MQVALSSQLNGKCVELASGPLLFSGVELPSTTPIKHGSRRNSWSSDGERCDRFGFQVLKYLNVFFLESWVVCYEMVLKEEP